MKELREFCPLINKMWGLGFFISSLWKSEAISRRVLGGKEVTLCVKAIGTSDDNLG